MNVIPNRSVAALLILFVAVLILGLPWGATNTQLSVIMLISTLLAALFHIRQWFRLPVVFFSLAVFIINCAVFLLKDEYSIWQFFRSGVPFLATQMALVAGIEIARVSRSEHIELLFRIVLVSALLNVGFYYLGWFTPNTLIAVSGRIYTAPSLALFPILYYFTLQRQWLLVAACYFVLAATGSKVVLVTEFVIVLFAWLATIRTRPMSAGNLVAPILAISAAYYAFGLYADRFRSFFESGDTSRMRQIADAWSAITDGIWGALFGHSFGIPTMPGYGGISQQAEENAKLFENSMYDIDSGFFEILLKVGFVGAMIFIWMYGRLPITKEARNLVSLVVFTNLFASGAIIMSADGVFCHLVLGIVATQLGGILPSGRGRPSFVSSSMKKLV